ncbi:hypothetical protein FH063_002908 [Azospirillum argentinense]|uniref:Uncharacterized protein n=1 Tax=Azospirillum argentinense TaxID=2970906 RepID=A0A5B0KMW4_9PROT|nr:hypothetical protein FH063_002908 [Azospirillum argentinense]
MARSKIGHEADLIKPYALFCGIASLRLPRMAEDGGGEGGTNACHLQLG